MLRRLLNMAAPSRVAIRQATAMEDLVSKVDEILERIEAIEKILSEAAKPVAKPTPIRKASKQ
jgi:hypothetical protein